MKSELERVAGEKEDVVRELEEAKAQLTAEVTELSQQNAGLNGQLNKFMVDINSHKRECTKVFFYLELNSINCTQLLIF